MRYWMNVIGLACLFTWASPLLGARNSDYVRLLLKENRLKEAIPICRQFEVLGGGAGKNTIDCAWVYFRTNRIAAAEKILLKMKRSNAPAVRLLRAYSYIKQKQYDRARDALNVLEKEFKGRRTALDVQEIYAELYETMGRMDTAAFIYKQIVGDDASRGVAHWGLARHHLARRENSKAELHLIETARRWPKHLASRYNLGLLYMSQENLIEAGRWLAECYRLNRGDAGVLEQLGSLFEKKGQFGDAIKYWQKALDVDRNSPIAKKKLKEYYGTLIDRAIAERRFRKALVYLENAERLGNKSSRNLLRRGIVFRNLEKYEKAAGDILAYLNRDPKDPQALRELGICYLNMSLFEEAQEYFEKAIELSPKEGMNYAWYAWVLEKKGKHCEARQAWKRATVYIRDPKELVRATRRLAAVNRRTRGKCKD